ncbi:MAG: UDP-N-acetylmuramoyl-L-alanyl-D-glutamate--2,6-diaminopimelate ligase [Gammaproteobacteria bacterium]|nr:UDP-N-acetylmuramoyl-L-alanyl-D-glutamate--2,6-diaminopimelate ligase [Gammaproteobacteria bacterium]
MDLSTCLAPWAKEPISPCDSQRLVNDSRKVQPGDAFLAYPGAVVDGRDYIQQAILQGANAIIYEPKGSDALKVNVQDAAVPLIPIENLAALLSEIAARFYAYPANKLKLIGITGTNGKTTTAYQLAHAYTLLGSPSRYIGTLGEGAVPTLSPLVNTTPDGLCLQQLFHHYVSAGVERVCMEVSSHALSLGRVSGLPFQQALFSNLTREHLDFHQTMQAYSEAKALLFATEGLRYAILNGDDPASSLMAARALSVGAKTLFYGFNEQHDIHVTSCQMHLHGTRFQVQTPWGSGEIRLRALGRFNVYNALAVMASLLVEGYPLPQVLSVLGAVHSVPGRMEIVTQHPCTVVDYAHTPDALENVLNTLKQIHQGKLIVVFGCGGDRDKGKRPLMGKIASDYADVLVITSDNPRSEDPDVIIADIQAGVVPGVPVHVMPDRHQAIEKAVELAGHDDLIIVAGKGHEAYQQVGQTSHAFSDQDVIRTLLKDEV